MRSSRRWLCTGFCLFLALPALAATQAFRGAAFDERLAGEPTLEVALRSAKLAAGGLPLGVRLAVERAEVETQPGAYDFAALDARMALYGKLGVGVFIDLRAAVPAADGIEAWGRFVHAVAQRYRTFARGYFFGGPGDATPPAAEREYAFYVKTTVVNLRSGDSDTVAILRGLRATDTRWLESLYAQDVSAYVDAVAVAAGASAAEQTALLAVVADHDSSASVVVVGQTLGEDEAAAPERFLTAQLGSLGTRVSGITYAAPSAAVAAALPPFAALRDLLGQELVTLEDAAVGLKLTRAGQDVSASVPHRLLFGLQSAVTYGVVDTSAGALELAVSERTGTRPTIVNVLARARQPARSFTYDSVGRIARVGLPSVSGPLVVDWSTGDNPSFAARQDVSESVLPSVAEILARHQQAQAAQDALLKTYVADVKMEQHFRSTASDPGFDVVTENRFYAEGQESEWEELGFWLNGTRWGPNRPAFPLLQAEKVLSLPLDLRLDADYRYRLEGVEKLAERECYALRFDPVDPVRSLYSGTVWIDRETYLKAKIQTVQAHLSAPVVSNEEIQYFTQVGATAGREMQLRSRVVGRQIMLIAGRNLLVERDVRFESFRLNPSDFEALREASRHGGNVMYRDTDRGLRYLVKRDGERVVQEKSTRSATALAFGATYDPSYDYPLPIAGINYLDFDFLGPDNQLAVLFAGILVLGNVQRPKLLGEHVSGSLDLFAIAVKGNDSTYDTNGEVRDERVRTLPFSTGANLGWQFAEFQKLLANYQFRYDSYSRDDLTAPDFEVPASGVTNGVGLGWEWKQGGYSFLANGTYYARAGWEPWGAPGDYDPSHKDYWKYSASLSKDFFFGLQKIHLNTAYFGGRDLDRFSMYQFGFFEDNRIHGVPSSGVRFAELGMLRASYSFNLFDQYRVDVSLDQALGRDPRVDSRYRPVTGVGLGFNLRGPWSTLLRGDFGKSFLPAEYQKPGSVVFQFQVLKPL